MEIRKNDLCSCGSGKKYKDCCLKENSMSEYDLIKKVVAQEKYNQLVADFICNLYKFMKEIPWIGACHATCSIMYVGFCELGYNPKLYIGEATIPTVPRFDHSWITLDEKVVDLAIALPLSNDYNPTSKPLSNPIVFDINIATNTKHDILYGCEGAKLDDNASFVFNTPFVQYMENDMENGKYGGLWGILERVFPKDINITEIKKKYDKVQRIFIE